MGRSCGVVADFGGEVGGVGGRSGRLVLTLGYVDAH